jgi:hypothetical protein
MPWRHESRSSPVQFTSSAISTIDFYYNYIFNFLLKKLNSCDFTRLPPVESTMEVIHSHGVTCSNKIVLRSRHLNLQDGTQTKKLRGLKPKSSIFPLSIIIFKPLFKLLLCFHLQLMEFVKKCCS